MSTRRSSAHPRHWAPAALRPSAGTSDGAPTPQGEDLVVPGPSWVFAAAATHLRIPAPEGSGWDFLWWPGLPAVPAAGWRRDFPSGLRVKDSGRDFRRRAESGRGFPAPEVWGVGLPGLGPVSGGDSGTCASASVPRAAWLGRHGRQRTARLALRGGGLGGDVTGECWHAIFSSGPQPQAVRRRRPPLGGVVLGVLAHPDVGSYSAPLSDPEPGRVSTELERAPLAQSGWGGGSFEAPGNLPPASVSEPRLPRPHWGCGTARGAP